jgi:hypothetical protein
MNDKILDVMCEILKDKSSSNFQKSFALGMIKRIHEDQKSEK